MSRRHACEGKVHRYGEMFACLAGAAFAVKDEQTETVKGTCRHHLAQTIDLLGADRLVVVRLEA